MSRELNVADNETFKSHMNELSQIKEKSKSFTLWFGSQKKFLVKPIIASLFESLFEFKI